MQVRRLAMLVLLIHAGAVFSDGGAPSPAPGKSLDPAYVAGEEAIKQHHWKTAIERFRPFLDRPEYAADAYNWTGYAERQQGNLDQAFRAYGKALALNPEHRGAHEYIGEAYLMAGKLAKAEEHLRVLDKLCRLPCGEYTDLKRKIADYKKRGG